MKHAKKLGLFAAAAAILMMLAGTAAATELTSPKNTKLKNGAEISGESATTEIHAGFSGSNLTCKSSTMGGKILDEGSATTTVRVTGTLLSFSNCGVDTVTTLDPGILEIHTLDVFTDNTGAVTSSGTAVTMQFHRTILGVPVTTHCLFETNETYLGTLVGSNHEGHKTAMLRVNATIPAAETDTPCTVNAEWTGTYFIGTPDELYVD